MLDLSSAPVVNQNREQYEQLFVWVENRAWNCQQKQQEAEKKIARNMTKLERMVSRKKQKETICGTIR